MVVAIDDFNDEVILLQLLISFRFLFFVCNASSLSFVRKPNLARLIRGVNSALAFWCLRYSRLRRSPIE